MAMRFITTFQKLKRLRLHHVLKKKDSLQSFFQKQVIDLVFIHGSLAHDKLKPLSDVDVAILFHKDYKYSQLAKVNDKLSKFFEREDIDIAVLNRASPLLWMQVLQNGVLLYCRNEKFLKHFRLRTIQRYLATKYLRRTFNYYMGKAILRSV